MKPEDRVLEELSNELEEFRQRIINLIKDAREYAENIVETVREPLVILDADLRVVSANQSFYRTFHVSKEETENVLLYELGNRQWDIPKLRELLEEVLPTNTTIEEFEVSHDFVDIGRRTMLLNARHIYREANKTQLILLAIEDITARRKAEEALASERERLAVTLRSIGDGVIATDTEDYLEEEPEIDEGPFLNEELHLIDAIGKRVGNIIEHKRAEEALKEYSEKLEEMIEQRTKELKRQKDVLEAINKVFQEAITRETLADVGNTCLTVAEELTGSKFGFIALLNQKNLSDTFAISDPGYAACKIPGTEQIKLLADMTLDGIDRSTMREGKSRIVNDPANHPDRKGAPQDHPPISSFLGVPLKLEGKTIGMIGLANKEGGYQVTDQESIEALTVAFVEALEKIKVEIIAKQRTKELEEAQEALEEMVEERTKELRDAQEELVRKEKLAVIGQLAGGVGHELRNPLGAIKNVAYFLKMVIEDADPEVSETLEILEKEVATSERIINSLLDFARIKSPNLQQVYINDIVTEATSRIKVPENVELVSQLDKSLPMILADPDLLNQVFGNIILNAIQA